MARLPTIAGDLDGWGTVLNEWLAKGGLAFNIKDGYDAVGDGVADDTAEIQAAIDACDTAGGGIVFFPPGTYKTTATVNIKQDVHLVGAGMRSTTISYTGSSHAVLFGSGTETVENDAWTGLAIEDLAIVGTSSGLSGIRVRGCSRFSIRRVRVASFSAGAGIYFNGNCWMGEIHGGRITGCDRGISFRKETAGGETSGNAVEIHGGLEVQDCAYGIEVGHPTTTETGNLFSAAGVEIHGVTVENCTTTAIYNISGDKISVHDCYLEDNPVMIQQGAASGNTSQPKACSYKDNYLTHVATGTAFDIKRGVRPKIEDNYIFVSAGTVTGYALTANVTFALIKDNYESGLTTVFSGDTAGNLHARSLRNYPVATVASAATITIPGGIEQVYISGTTTITSITAAADSKVVRLIFNGILTLTDGSNLFLNGNFVTTATDTIVLMSDGSNWIEHSRSVN